MKKQSFANETPAKNGSGREAQLFVNISAIDEKGHVQLAPYGDFLNVDNKGQRVIQRFSKEDADAMVNEFNAMRNLPTRLLGLPWYIGHPDHSRFKGVHSDTRAYGRIKSIEAGTDGLYANVRFSSAGKQLLDEQAYHGHSINWVAVPRGRENGFQIYRPITLKSVGFTNEPGIPVYPAALANEEIEDPNAIEEPDMIIPPKLKLIAGFKADEDVTMDQILSALQNQNPPKTATPMSNQKAVELKIGDETFSVTFANEADGAALLKRISTITGDLDTNKKGREKADQDLANEKKVRAEERKARAVLVVDPLVKAGKIVTSARDAKIEELCNAEDFEAKAKEFANEKSTVKTTPKSGELAGKNVVASQDARARQSKLEQLLSERAQNFPNESYDERFNAVANSDAGKQLFTQMQRPGSDE